MSEIVNIGGHLTPHRKLSLNRQFSYGDIMATFNELGVGKRLCEAITDMGWTEPTPIQEQAVPAGMAGADLLGQAQTGTGKTGAYSLIVLGRTRPGSDKPTTVVMAPTRELADQVSKEIRNISRVTHHTVVAVYGGTGYEEQIARLKRGCDVVVGTPGRILDLQRRGHLDLSQVKELVIDEADRMLDMGFIEDMEMLISLIPEGRQTLMFSATVSDLVTQYYVECKRNGKMDVLRDIMSNGNPKMVIFCSTKKMVDDLYEGFSQEGLKVGALHGDMPQFRRDRTIRGFKSDRMPILIATDVAARGLDIDNIECVVNYDAPLDPETYTHRIGRAGRAGRTGVSFTFITPKEDRRIPSYEEYMGREIQKVSRKQISKLTIANPELKQLHHDEPEEQKPRREKVKVRAVIRKPQAEKSFFDVSVVSLDIGKSSGVSRTDVISFIISKSHIGEDRIGRIGMSTSSSFVEIDSSVAGSVVKTINGAKLNGKSIHAQFAPEKTKCKDKLKSKKS